MGYSMFRKFGKWYYYSSGSFRTMKLLNKEKSIWKKRSKKTGIDFKTKHTITKATYTTKYGSKMKTANKYYNLFVLNGNMYKGKILKNK